MSNILQAKGSFTVTPSDTTDLTKTGVTIYVGGTGNLKVDMSNGDTVTFMGIQVGSFLPVQVNRVYSTGTTATNILALYD